MTALPMTAPSWRIVFSTADAEPAMRGSMFRMATVVIGAKVIPIPAPATIAGTKKLIHVESGQATKARLAIQMVKRSIQVSRMNLTTIRSAKRLENGTENIEVRALTT